MRRALNWALTLVLVASLAVVLALVLMPRLSSWRFDAVLSGSMEPALAVGSVVVVEPAPASEIEPGQIITYLAGEVLVTHRVKEIVSGEGGISFITKGDANEEADLAPAPASKVVGRVVFDIPLLGYVASFVKTREGLLLAIFVPGTIIIALELRSMWRTVLEKNTPDPA